MRPVEPGVGYTVNRIGGRASIIIDEPEAAPSNLHPFKVSVVKVGSDWAFKVRPGTLNSMVPTLSGTPINTDPAPTLSISTSGVVYLTANAADGSAFPTTVSINFATTLPATTDSQSFVRIAEIDYSGATPKVSAQYVETSLWGERLKCGSNAAEYYYSRS